MSHVFSSPLLRYAQMHKLRRCRWSRLSSLTILPGRRAAMQCWKSFAPWCGCCGCRVMLAVDLTFIDSAVVTRCDSATQRPVEVRFLCIPTFCIMVVQLGSRKPVVALLLDCRLFYRLIRIIVQLWQYLQDP